MLRSTSILVLCVAAATAQDHIIPFGFTDAGGPPGTAGNSWPAARIKDANLDGVIAVPAELHTFLSTCYHTTGGVCFMTDVRAVRVNGDYEFYFTDSEQGRVVRGVDKNHNGVLDRGEDTNGNGVLDVGEDTNSNGVLDTEVSEFFFFGVRTQTGATPNTNLLAPDTLGVYFDQGSGQVRVYVAIDNNAALPSNPTVTVYPRAIHKLVDLNGDGDAKDPGEQSVFVNSSIPLLTPGQGIPLPNFWQQVRVLPNGKIIGYSSGVAVPIGNPLASTNENCFYAFTDNGGPTAATADIWFNCSVLNTLPLHPDFANGTFPAWDIDYDNAGVPTRRTFARWVAVAERGGLAGVVPAYYIASSYTWSATATAPSFGDTNPNGQHVSGLIYRVNDFNSDGVIDPGELQLWANFSGQTYNGVAPISFVNIASGLPVNTLDDRTWAVDASPDGEFSFLYANAGPDAIVSVKDANFSGVVEAGEAVMVFAATTVGGVYPPPMNPTLGAFFNSQGTLEDGTLPGPFPVGIAPSGNGCIAPTRGLRVLMDAFGGSPAVGNAAFALAAIGAQPGLPALLAYGGGFLPAPLPLSGAGFPAGCTLDIIAPTTFAFGLSDARGRILFGLPIPNNPSFIGQSLTWQAAVGDPGSAVPLPWHTTNAVLMTIQP